MSPDWDDIFLQTLGLLLSAWTKFLSPPLPAQRLQHFSANLVNSQEAPCTGLRGRGSCLPQSQALHAQRCRTRRRCCTADRTRSHFDSSRPLYRTLFILESSSAFETIICHISQEISVQLKAEGRHGVQGMDGALGGVLARSCCATLVCPPLGLLWGVRASAGTAQYLRGCPCCEHLKQSPSRSKPSEILSSLTNYSIFCISISFFVVQLTLAESVSSGPWMLIVGKVKNFFKVNDIIALEQCFFWGS